MTLADDFHDAKADIQLAARKATIAELANHDWEQDGDGQNTHFEFRFGGEWGSAYVPELYLYVERYDGDTGVELMVWADVAWFSQGGLDADYPSPEDADNRDLPTFCAEAADAVAEEIGHNTTPSWEFTARTGGCLVFSASFFVDETNYTEMSGYACRECGNVERFRRYLEIEEQFERQDNGDWAGDHSQEEIREVHDVICQDCETVVY